MKVHELLNTQLEEGWKEKAVGAVAAATIAGAMLSPKFNKAPEQPKEKPQVVIQNENSLQRELRTIAEKAGISGIELAQLLAQAAHETNNFRSLVEVGNKKYFAKYDKPGSKKAKLLGNVKPGDGEKFKGRGFLQITGRYNYNQLSKALNLPLLDQPELLEKPDVAAKAAIWYWNNRVKPHVNDFSNTPAVTKKINSALHGLERREQKFSKFVSLLGLD